MKHVPKAKVAVVAEAVGVVSVAKAAVVVVVAAARNGANPAGKSLCNTRPELILRPQIRSNPHGYAVGYHVQEKTKRDRAHGETARQVCQKTATQDGEADRSACRRYGRAGGRFVRTGRHLRTGRWCGRAARRSFHAGGIK